MRLRAYLVLSTKEQKMNLFLKVIILFSTIAMLSNNATASQISWTDWTSANGTSSASGELDVDGSIVNIVMTSTSNYNFVQTGTGTDTNFWTGSAYTNGTVDNAPTGSEMVSLNTGGTVTLTFSSAIQDIYIALNSWNGNVVDFGEAISFDSVGSGYWGTGSAILNTAGTGFTGVGELHGVVQILGDFTTISFEHTSEAWHGFTIGVAQLADTTPVPAPQTLFLIALGLGLISVRKLRSTK